MTLNKEDMKALTDKYAKMCGENDTVEQNLFAEYGVKRGLRDANGRGVLTGLTEISDVLLVHSLSSLFPAKQGIGFFFRAV